MRPHSPTSPGRPPRVIFRVDSSRLIGTGHLVRCLTLARVLRERGAEVRFITRLHPGNLLHRLTEECFPVTTLPPPPASDTSAEGYARWVGVPWEQDARETAAAIGKAGPDWLIVDHYGLGAGWETALRPSVKRLFVIDDLVDRAHDCDLLLNQNFGLPAQHTASCARQLLGPRYALLHPAYADWRNRSVEESAAPGRLLLYFGGVDADNITGRCLGLLSEPPFRELAVDVIVGAASVHREALQRLSDARPGTRLLEPRPHLAELFSRADLAISAGGSTTWERCCLGLPSLVLCLAENQRRNCEELARAEIISYLGPAAECPDAAFRTALRGLLDSPTRRRRLRVAGMALVDGLGAMRVAEVLAPSCPQVPRITQSHPQDMASGSDLSEQLPPPSGTVSSTFTLWQGPLPAAVLRIDASPDAITPHFAVDRDFTDPALPGQLLWFALRRLRAGNPDFQHPLRHPTASGGRALVFVSDEGSWSNPALAAFVLECLAAGHRIQWVHDAARAHPAEICFFLSYGKIVTPDILARCSHNLVVHGSALPAGKGWSPLTWQVLEGKTEIPMTLFEAAASVDSGPIYAQTTIHLDGTELVEQLREKQAETTFALCSQFLKDYPASLLTARPQVGTESFYPRRRAADSQLDPARPLREQFPLLRVVDNEAYPAFFEHLGQRYRISIHKD